MLSSACQDTIRAAVWLATKPLDEYHRIQIISEVLNLPYHFLAKSLQKLVHAEILTSHRGASGGVKLSRNASEITLISIIHAVDGTVLFDTCLLGIGECEAEKPCALHAQWEIWRNEIDAMYSAMRLEELVADFANSKIKRL